jgi:hypothetical protein
MSLAFGSVISPKFKYTFHLCDYSHQSLEQGKEFHTCSTVWLYIMAAEKTVQCCPNTNFPMYKVRFWSPATIPKRMSNFPTHEVLFFIFFTKISHLICLKLLYNHYLLFDCQTVWFLTISITCIWPISCVFLVPQVWYSYFTNKSVP